MLRLFVHTASQADCILIRTCTISLSPLVRPYLAKCFSVTRKVSNSILLLPCACMHAYMVSSCMTARSLTHPRVLLSSSTETHVRPKILYVRTVFYPHRIFYIAVPISPAITRPFAAAFYALALLCVCVCADAQHMAPIFHTQYAHSRCSVGHPCRDDPDEVSVPYRNTSLADPSRCG